MVTLVSADRSNRSNGLAEPIRVYEKQDSKLIRTNMNYDEMFGMKYNNIVIDSTIYHNKDSIIDYIFKDYSPYYLMRNKIFFNLSDTDTIFVNSPLVKIDTVINLKVTTDFIIRNDSIIFDNKCPISEYTDTYKDIIGNSTSSGTYNSNFLIKIYSDSLEHIKLLKKYGNLDEEHFTKYFYIIPNKYWNGRREYTILFSPYRNYENLDYYIEY